MKLYKRLKDPIYGYIDIPIKYMNQIIDTSSFQRLRRIIQTSYSPLYSSAVHNRFVHSIGVYYLGELACEQLIIEIKQLHFINEEELKIIAEVFKLACLLHDVGHAPFSHTGEEFYLTEDRGYSELHNELIESIQIESFKKDVPTQNVSAASPHEIMSAIIGINEYSDFFQNAEQKEFFARCITGYKYSEESDVNSIKNCFINMLNSKVIDVDKLDYLIRDAYLTGFDTVSIDFKRLLTSLTIVKNNSRYELAYYKSAISVIENVVYAHDAERKWIQNHPVVLYEIYLLQNIIAYLNSRMNKENKRLFAKKSLGKEGETFDSLRISLMSDDDIIFLMKNVYSNDLSEEFFERRLRRHPIWKSEAEYKAYVHTLSEGGTILEKFEEAMEATAKYLVKNTDTWVIDNNLIQKLEQDIQALEQIETIDSATKEVQKKDKKNIQKIVTCLKEYAQEKQIECNFVVLMASQFNSGFGKPDFSDMNIVFKMKDSEKIMKVGKIVSSLEAREKERNNFFYIFYKREQNMDEETVNIDKEELCTRLIKSVF